MGNVIQTLRERGFIDRLTDPELEKLGQQEQLVVYCGVDPTADSLHVGNLLPLLMLVHFQRAGHRPIALVGGATGLVGDPGGKKDERNLLSRDQVEENVNGIRRILERLFSFEGDNAAIVVNNIDWMGEVGFLDFIRDVGKHVRITEMLARDSVKARLDSGAGMSYTEFSYQLLQAYDFFHLYREFQCQVQVGGSDQWGNITAGTDLIRRMDGGGVYGMVCPLLTTESGEKLGKSEGNTVWLTSDKTSPYQLYQYFIRTEDVDAVRLLKLLTFLSLDEISELNESLEKNPERREAQKRLAREVTELIHGPEGAEAAEKASEVLFGGELSGLGSDVILEIFSDVPTFAIDTSRLEGAYSIVEALTDSSLAESKGEARRLLDGGGVYLNNQRVESSDTKIGRDSLLDGDLVVLRVGKKKYCLGKVATRG